MLSGAGGQYFSQRSPARAAEALATNFIGNLRKNYSWAMRHRLGGESLGQIAEEFGVAKSTVVDGIDSILARLPEPELVNKKFWDRICRLRSP